MHKIKKKNKKVKRKQKMLIYLCIFDLAVLVYLKTDVINMISEMIIALKIYEIKKRLFRPETKMKFSVKGFSVNVIKCTFSYVFGEIY